MDSDRSTKHHQSSSHENKPTKHPQPSSSELLSSAKLVAEAAFNRDSNHKVDKAKVANAAGDLLGAVSHYGKLEEKGYGKFVGQAENYLHKYGQNSHSTPTTTNSGHSASANKPTTTSTTNISGHSASSTKPNAHLSSHHSDDHGKSGSGYGDYIKMAEGLFKKH